MHRAKSGPVGEKALMVEPGAFFERRRQLESILFVREWQRLCQRAGQVWRQEAEAEDRARLRRRSELGERGAWYGGEV
jgi:hypothetical protein